MDDKNTLAMNLQASRGKIIERIIDAAQIGAALADAKAILAETRTRALAEAGDVINGKNAEERDVKRDAYLLANKEYASFSFNVANLERRFALASAACEADKMTVRIYEMLVKLATA